MAVPRRKFKQLTDAEADALLDRIVPGWSERLADPVVIDRIADGLMRSLRHKKNRGGICAAQLARTTGTKGELTHA